MSWLATKAFFKKAWAFVRDQWLFFFTGIVGIVGFILGSRGGEMEEELAKSKEESNRARAERDEKQRQLIDTFQARLAEINEDIEERGAELDEEKEKEIQAVVKELQKELSEEEVRTILKEKVPSFNYVPPSRFGEVSDG